jgi:hypothetical protein
MQGTPMFLKGVTPSSASGFVNLSIVGSHSGTQFGFGIIPFYMNGVALTTSMNMFLLGQSQAIHTFASGTTTFFLQGGRHNLNNNYNLYINGGHGGKPLNNGFNLYINGTGQNSNFNPYSSYMNMFLQGKPAANNNFPMYMKTKDTVTKNINCYLFGITGLINASTNLYLKAINTSTSGVQMFIRGFVT